MDRRLLVIEDDTLLREFLGAACPQGWQATLVGTGGDALRTIHEPGALDVVLADLGLPDVDGVELIRAIASARPELPIIVLSVCTAAARILDAFRAGARGYVFKEDLLRGLAPVLDQALAGGAPMSRAVAGLVLEQLRPGDAGRAAASTPEPRAALTDREQQVLEQLGQGLSYAQVGAALEISQNTVRSYIRAIYEKLCVGTKTEAVLVALRMGLLASAPPT